jgi:hypothetical protein
LAAVSEDIGKDVGAAILKRDDAIDLKAVKEALNLEWEVPGADLMVNQFTLQIR